MKMKNESKRQPMSLLLITVLTGFFGGMFWCLLGYAAHYFHFTVISPVAIFKPIKGAWKTEWQGFVLVVLVYGLLSILVALLYYALLRKQASLVWGIGYGAALFLLIFAVFYPVIPGIKGLATYPMDTIITEACLFLLYGLFVGYSISYEYQEIIYLEKTKLKQ